MKKVLVSGNFNILHLGHLRLLRFAKECGDHLIVSINSDYIAGNKSVVHEDLRLEGIKASGLVDEAFISDRSILEVIREIRPDIVVKGKEYELVFNQELAELESYGGKLIFSSGESTFSTLDLLRGQISSEKSALCSPKSFISRHKIDSSELVKIVSAFSELKVTVVGDLIIDEYVTCDALGMSQEDPTIVVAPRDTSTFLGGAGIVAAHAAGLGANVSYVGVSGNDREREFALDKLKEYRVDASIITDDTRPTTLKKRYRAKGKTLLRVSHLHQEPISNKLQEKIFEKIKLSLVDSDLLVFSDFNYGCLPQSLVEKICNYAIEVGVLMAADSQSSSQIGDISRFAGMDLVTPTEREARISTKNYVDGLAVLACDLRIQSKAANIILKLGEDGALIHTGSQETDEFWHTDQIEPLNKYPLDPAGAGDSMLIVSSMAMAAGANIWVSACLGSYAAGIQVGRIGNIPLSASELVKELIF